MLALDPRACDIRVLKVAVKAMLRIPAPGPQPAAA
jgi:hypothetical protein